MPALARTPTMSSRNRVPPVKPPFRLPPPIPSFPQLRAPGARANSETGRQGGGRGVPAVKRESSARDALATVLGTLSPLYEGDGKCRSEPPHLHPPFRFGLMSPGLEQGGRHGNQTVPPLQPHPVRVR